MKKYIKFSSVLLCVLLSLVLFSACKGEKKDSVSKLSESVSVNGDTLSSESVTTASDGSTSAGAPSSGASDVTVSFGATSTGTPSQGTGGSSSGDGSSPSQPAESTVPTVCLSATRNGDTVTVTANIGNNPGITAFQFGVTYNRNAVTPESIQNGLVSVTSNLQQGKDCGGTVTAVYVGTDSFSNDGALFSVTFNIKNSAETLEFGIKAEKNSFLDKSGSDFCVFETDGTTVK